MGAFLWKNSKLDSCLNLERNFLFLYTETDFKPKLRVDLGPGQTSNFWGEEPKFVGIFMKSSTPGSVKVVW